MGYNKKVAAIGGVGVARPLLAIHETLIKKTSPLPIQLPIEGFPESKKLVEKYEKIEIDRNLLVQLQKRMEMLIHLTPTGELRNKLTDENIELLDVLYT